MNFIILLFSYSHKCSTLVSIRNKKPKNGLSKCQWNDEFTNTKPFPKANCMDIGRQDFPNDLRNAFQEVTFGKVPNDEGNAQIFDSAICHVLSYVAIRTYVCDHLDSYFNLLQSPKLGWLQYHTIHPFYT